MKYIVTSRHAEDLGMGRPLAPYSEFDSNDVPDHMKDRLQKLESMGRVFRSASKKTAKKEGGE